MAEILNPPQPKFTPRSGASDFVSSLPKLGVDDAALAAIAPIEQDPPAPPEPKPTPTTVEPKPAVVPPVEDKMPRSAKDWDAYRAANKKRLDEKDAELQKVQARIQELESKPNPTAVDETRLKALEQEKEELSEKLRIVDVTQHPKFKAYYDGKTNAQIELAKRIVGTDKSEAIAKLLAQPDSEFRQERLETLLAQLSPIQQSRVGAVMNSLVEIDNDRAAQIEKSKTDFVAVQEQQKKSAETQQADAMKKAETLFSNIVSTAQNPKDKEGLFIYQKQDGNEEWNKGVDERLAAAKSMLFGKHPPEALMKYALHAAALPGLTKAYQGSLARISELEAQVKGLETAQPTLRHREGGEGGEKGAGGSEKKKSNFLNGRGDAADWIKSTEVQ